MKTFDSITKYMSENNMLTYARSVVVGVSGGADSVALLRVLVALREKKANEESESRDTALYIRVIHVNHMIRGAEADRDEAFVVDLCKKLEVDCKVYREDIPKLAKEKHLTEEEAGRIFRYECFNKEAEEISRESAVQIAVAHNKDDLAETVLFNMIRGSALLGLAGIKPVNGSIIRPLLMTSREEIELYLEELGQDYITDSTNLVTDYTRNKLRLSVMPSLKEINSGAVDHIVDIASDSLKLTKDIEGEIFRDYYRKLSDTGVSIDGLRTELNIEQLLNLGKLAQGELVLSHMETVAGRRKDITREHIGLVLGLAEMESGKQVNLPYDMIAFRSYDKIVIAKKEVVGESGESKTALGSIKTEVIPFDPSLDLSKKEYTKLIDYDKINSQPVLRTPEPEDYIVIDQSGGTKKLSRFLSHSKVEREERLRFPVVADGNEIIWAVGLRLSERYKVTETTKQVMRITYIKESS